MKRCQKCHNFMIAVGSSEQGTNYKCIFCDNYEFEEGDRRLIKDEKGYWILPEDENK